MGTATAGVRVEGQGLSVERQGRVMLALLTAAAVTIGVGPVACAWGQWLVIPGAFGIAAVTAFAVARIRSASTALPRPFEFVLAAVDAVAPAAALCGFFFAAYGIALLVIQVLSYAGVDWDLDATARLVAGVCSLALVPTFTYITLDSVRGKLYPPVAGALSPYHSFATTNPVQVVVGALAALLVPAAAIAFLLAEGISHLWAAGALALYTTAASVVAAPRTEDAEPGGVSPDILRRLEGAFAAAGYHVKRRPRTFEQEVDPLLVELNLVAQKDDRGVAVEIKQGGAGADRLRWTDGTRLATAARVLQSESAPIWSADSPDEPPLMSVSRMDPVLVLVDCEADESLQRFAEVEHVALLSICTSERSARVTSRAANDTLREVARRYVELLPKEASIDPPGTPAVAP